MQAKYSINGKGEYWKNGVALELVKLYMTDNPSTYQRLNNIFNGKINHYLITKDDADKEILLSNDSRKEQRWHIKTPLKSCDNVIFYVTTQVGVNCQIDFNDIVDLAGELGYTIKEV